MPKEVSGYCNMVRIAREIGKRVSYVVLKMSGKFIQPGSGK